MTSTFFKFVPVGSIVAAGIFFSLCVRLSMLPLLLSNFALLAAPPPSDVLFNFSPFLTFLPYRRRHCSCFEFSFLFFLAELDAVQRHATPWLSSPLHRRADRDNKIERRVLLSRAQSFFDVKMGGFG